MTTASLALCFDAPLQSWGTRSRGIIRDTTREPTKSGVVGLLAAALGKHRGDDEATEALANLHMAVRVDREGILERDYHTTQNVPTTEGKGHRTVVSERYYLADALFLVVLEGDPALLQELHDRVDRPHWPLFFGRRAFVPARPLLTREALSEQPAADVIATHSWLEIDVDVRNTERLRPATDRAPLRTVTDCTPTTPGAEPRHDHPVSIAQRTFRTRHVLVADTDLTDEMIRTGETSCS
ncbi:CRISPR system Cascade subunit CasD [Saccharothrix saharensis]|uniref:CRISPR system Cascade subunit CasD n=1 Tax=Saccharothrix saharensis TaxID=571190 RepID=A0A543J5R2_9PSEU|nr:type I-E CRISPR-associated protein Cas5/CasD [Saccharothrix saharensis]TQM78176.1 CRISPR system Cascade subunit CasD [Saccharothrix saharensis]